MEQNLSVSSVDPDEVRDEEIYSSGPDSPSNSKRVFNEFKLNKKSSKSIRAEKRHSEV